MFIDAGGRIFTAGVGRFGRAIVWIGNGSHGGPRVVQLELELEPKLDLA